MIENKQRESRPTRAEKREQGETGQDHVSLPEPVSTAVRTARRVVVLVIGLTVVLFGAVLLVTPGPGLLLIALGLLVLSSEFAWARYWLRRARREAAKADRNVGLSRLLKRWFLRLRRKRTDAEDG